MNFPFGNGGFKLASPSLQQKGKGAQTYYVATEKLLQAWRMTEVEGLGAPGPEAQSGKLPPQSGNPSPLSGNLPAQSGNLAAEDADQVTRFEPEPGLPPDLEAKLRSLKQRLSRPEMEELVWQLCNWRAHSAEDLARLLNRERKYIQDGLLTPMLRSGRLELTIPDAPNHPSQQYRAATPRQQPS